jgi:hypothetical protein
MDKRTIIFQGILMGLLFVLWVLSDDVNEKLNMLFLTSWLAFIWRM